MALRVKRCLVLHLEFSGLGFMDSGLGFRDWGLGSRVGDLGTRG